MQTTQDLEIKRLNKIIINQRIELKKMSTACSIARNDLVSAIEEIYSQRDIIEDLSKRLFSKNKHAKPDQ